MILITQLLEGIGAISATERKKATSRSGNYQDSVTAPLSRTFDDDAVGKADEDEQDDVSLELDRSGNILSAVEKAGAFISVVDDMLTLFHSFGKSSEQYDQAPNASRVGSIKYPRHNVTRGIHFNSLWF
jgi:hypothetical protein